MGAVAHVVEVSAREHALALFGDQRVAEARIALGYILLSGSSIYYVWNPPRLGHDHGDEDDGEEKAARAYVSGLA